MALPRDTQTVDGVTVTAHTEGEEHDKPDAPIAFFSLDSTERTLEDTSAYLYLLTDEFAGRPYHEWEAYVAYMQDTK